MSQLYNSDPQTDALIQDVIARSRDAGISDEAIIAALQNAIEALEEGLS